MTLPYPAEWEADVVLSDGGTVHVRPIRPDDADRLVALHSRLSSESIYFRFFSPRPVLTDREIERFTTVDYDDRMAMVALLGDDLVAVARYDRWPGRDEAEVAFTVDDVHQGRGIATVLLEHLAAIARQRGIHRFTAETLPQNRKMLGVFRSAGFEASTSFNEGIIDVKLDIEPTEESLAAMREREKQAEARSVARLLNPASVAVIGASHHPGTIGNEVLRNLLSAGFCGTVWPINPHASHVAGVRAYASVIDVPDEVELAVVAVPAEDMARVVEQCARKRVQGLLVISAGFGEAGPAGVDAERDLVETSRRLGMRLIGPASMGVINTAPSVSMHASFAPLGVLPGRVAIAAQSGPLGIAILRLATQLGVGISTFVAIGNRADVSGNDLLQYWEDDDQTDVVLVYTESFGNPRKFSRIARRLSRRKPIVVVKSGLERMAPGAHRGPAVAPGAVEALFLQTGVIRVDSIPELFDVARVLAGQPLPKGRRVAVLTNTRHPGLIAADAAVGSGLVLAELDRHTLAALHEVVPPGSTITNPVDLTHVAEPHHYESALTAILDDPHVDALIAIHAPPLTDRADEVARILAAASSRADDVPIVATFLALPDGRQVLSAGERTVPSFEFPEMAAHALGKVATYAEWRRRPEGEVPELPGIDEERGRLVVEHALGVRPTGTLLPWSAAADLLDAYGIPLAAGRMVTSLEDTVAFAEAVGYPVALKATGLPRVARSEAGGVALDLNDADELTGAYQRMSEALGTAMAEALVQSMAAPGVELLAGLRHVRLFGPVVSFGLGGAFADAIGDTSSAVLPLTAVDVDELLEGSRAGAVLLDADGPVTYDVPALRDLLLRLGRLADDLPEVAEVQLNPVLLSASGAAAVDARIWVAPAALGVPDEVRRLG